MNKIPKLTIELLEENLKKKEEELRLDDLGLVLAKLRLK